MVKVMMPRKGDHVELSIEKMAAGGPGIATLDGWVIFVKEAVPGDRVLAKITRKRKNYGQGRILEILEASQDRVKPPCPYSGHCGGCQWQQIRYERQLACKKEIVSDALARIGSLKDVPVHDVIPSQRTYGYRNKMEFSFSDRRWLLPGEMDMGEMERGFALGLHAPGTFNKVIDMEACLLQRGQGNQLLGEVKAFVRESGVPVYGLKSHKGYWRFLVLRYSAWLQGWMVNIVTSEDIPEAIQPLAERLGTGYAHVLTVVNNITKRKAAVAVGEQEKVLYGDGVLKDRIGPFTFHISSNSFFQTNSLAAERLYEKVAAYAALKGGETVLDLYSGTGTIPIYLSSRAKEVIGIEITKSAIMDGEKNCAANGISNCRFLWGDIRECLPLIKSRPRVLIIDPPRAGVHKDALPRIRDLGAERIVYVSCNPSTLARDLGEIVSQYEVIEVQPLDMFPHTHHVELVALLSKRP
jgi:23S rRNA (uracil1939-C5)-methyltransferase